MLKQDLYLYNTLTKKKEKFQSLQPGQVGIYVCGPTVYGYAHLGHARSAIVFDVLVRYMKHLGYTVKYIRNITDVGHLERDSDDGEDKMVKKAKLESLSVMEIATYFTNSYRENLKQLNTLNPSVEPTATGHIIEQIELIKKIVKRGFAYEVKGSVYFDVQKYSQKHDYGTLSGRIVEDLINNTRTLSGQLEKRNPLDFALWKNASKTHIMKWPSPWGEGFPGWHIECSAMSTKYLGEQFDIHGGGLELCFPHHECEIAQCVAGSNLETQSPVKYWIHHNMVNIDGKKMGKSLNNFITLNQLFEGSHVTLDREYCPMTLRFFILQSHYRSIVNFSLEGLKNAEKGYIKFLNTLLILQRLKVSELSGQVINNDVNEPSMDGFITRNSSTHNNEKQNFKTFPSSFTEELNKLYSLCYQHMNDDLNTSRVIATLFDISKIINTLDSKNQLQSIGKNAFGQIYNFFSNFVADILGISIDRNLCSKNIIELIMGIYSKAKRDKAYDTVDLIRNSFKKENIAIIDKKNGGYAWQYIF